jgi:hypothetical protein
MTTPQTGNAVIPLLVSWDTLCLGGPRAILMLEIPLRMSGIMCAYVKAIVAQAILTAKFFLFVITLWRATP